MADLRSIDGDETARAMAEIVRRSGTSFYWAMRLLPRRKRDAMYAIYAFCRVVDDIADGAQSLAAKNAMLDEWQDELDRLYNGAARHPVAHALAEPVRDFMLAKPDFEAIVAGMRMDSVDRLRLSDFAELELYCDRVAGAVGRLSCAVFGIGEPQARLLAKSLGEALQFTNILRDVHEDAQRDRVYLPQDLLARHGCDGLDANGLLCQTGLESACCELASLAAARFDEAGSIMCALPSASVRPALIMHAVYRDILARLRERGWSQRLAEPIHQSKLQKYWLVCRAFLS